MSNQKEYRKDLIRNYNREFNKRDEENWYEKVIEREEYYDILDTSDVFDDQYFDQKREN